MFSKMTFRLTNYALILMTFSVTISTCTDGTGVPVLMWSTEPQTSKTDALNRKSSTITRIDSNVLRDDYLKQRQTIIAFIQNDLSIEQFSTEDKNQFKTLNQIISDQTLEPILLTDVLTPNEALKDFSVQNINELNVNNGNKIAINLPKNSLLENDELIGQLLHKISQNVSKNSLYLITGRQNSIANKDSEDEQQIEVNHRFRRHILADGSDKRRNREEVKRLVDVKGCLFFYMRSLTVSYYSTSQTNSTLLITTFDSLEVQPSLGDSLCWKDNGKEPALLDLTYQKSNTKLQIKLRIGKHINGFWAINKSVAILTDSNTQPIKYELLTDDISAEKLFSYSCSKLTVLSKAADRAHKSGLTQIKLDFNGFQLQPFVNPMNANMNPKSKYIVFAESFDCQPWMTLPLWMGLITLINFAIVVFLGVYILSQVNTPDRFENPKAKPLIVTNADE